MNIRRQFAAVAQIAIWLLPAKAGNYARRRFFKWELAADARIGFSFIQAKRVILHPGARVGHFNAIRNLELFEIGSGAQVGHLNRISGRPAGAPEYVSSVPQRSEFTLGRESAMTHRHYLDCTQSISIGEFVTVAGSHSQFWSHGIDVEQCRQTAEPISIGDYCMLGTRIVVLKGVAIGNCCVVAAGSVVTRSLDANVLAGGVPAKVIKHLEDDIPYFKRTIGAVS
jgi:acetyltransferase-like isoleucine patch superfamily enzyme